MLQGDLLIFEDYVREWAESNPDIQFFCFGGLEKGMEYARGFENFAYPFAWLETPSIAPEENEYSDNMDYYQSGLSVLVYAPLDNNQAQTEAYRLSLKILYDLRKKLRHDRKDGKIEFETGKMKIDPVLQLWADSHYGFRLEIEIGLNVNALVC